MKLRQPSKALFPHCKVCTEKAPKVQQAARNAAANSSDPSRRTCSVTGQVFATRSAMFRHIAERDKLDLPTTPNVIRSRNSAILKLKKSET